jgi:uncharacterized protein YjiS (DUF1127 family)
MIRLTELRGGQAASPAGQWDQRSLDAHAVVQTARDLRAAFIADRLRRGSRALGRWSGLTDLFAALRRRARHRRTVQALTALDHRVLNDIGINPAEIDATVALACAEKPSAGNSVWHGLAAWARRETRRRRTIRELSAMPDAILADIGLSRSEIPAVAAALVEARHREGGGDSVPAIAGIPATAATMAPAALQILAFMEARRSPRRAANENRDRPTAA